MSITISDTSPRVQYTATSGQTTFSVPFEFFDDDDIVVINTNAGGVDTTLTKSSNPSLVTEYSVSGAGETGGGSITLGAGATLNDKYTIYRDLPIARSTDFPNSGTFPIETLNTELDKIVAMMQQNERDFNFTVKAKATTSTAYGLTFPELVANKILSVNSAGNGLIFSQEIGNFRGNWAASTAYVQRDLVKDTSNGNIYIVNTAHTSSGSQPLSSNANSSYYDLIVDAASATSSASAALASATAAAASATAAAASETAAAASESAAATSETNAATSASTASTQASNAANSASAAATSATNASNSASAAATSATNSANSATAAASSATSAAGSASTATTQASNASTSASNAATSASNAATSESNAATSESNAATSASNASTSETNASNSATSASTSATNAANSAAAAEATFDLFDDSYLGAKASNPTLDNDGNALQDGALYFDTTNNVMKVYDLATTTWLQLTPTVSNQTNINTVAGISSDVSTVAGISSDVTTAAGISSNISTVAGISSNVTTVAGDTANIGTIATNLNGTDTIGTVAANISNVNTVGGISANVTTVAGISSDVTAVASDATDIGTVATNIANVNSVGGSIANVNTVASNIVGVNSFAERYRVDSSDPSTSLDAGDLVFNTTASALKYYDGSSWQQIVAGSLTEIVQDGSPQLGGNLDLNSNNITGTGNINITGSGTFSGDLTVDTNTLYVDSTNNKVGIGLTSNLFNILGVAGSIDVGGTGNSGLSFHSSSTDLSLSTQQRFLVYSASDGKMKLFKYTDGTFNSTLLAIDSSGNLGLGTDSPSAKLDVRGSAIFNEGGFDADFRVESNNNSNMLFVDGGTDRIGIGNASPQNTLHVDSSDSTIARFISSSSSGILQVGNSQVGTGTGPELRFHHNNNLGSRIISESTEDFASAANRSAKIKFNAASNGNNYDMVTMIPGASRPLVGIGTTSPSSPLDVVSGGTGAETIAEFGNGNISNGLTIQTNGNLDWGFNATNRNLTFSTTQVERMRITSGGDFVYNENSNDQDFRVESNNNTHMLFVDAGNDRVGIGTGSPECAFHVQGGQMKVKHSTSAFMTIEAGSASYQSILEFSDGGGAGALIYDHPTNKLNFKTNGTTNMYISSAGHLLPNTTNTYDLGSSSLVWRNIYTSDFHMSNEGLDKGNDIDGTKGSWTFQEGEDNLYLINNKNGKKYKFNLTEIE